jgi:hypothetical protein
VSDLNRRGAREAVTVGGTCSAAARERELHAQTGGAFDVTSTPLSRCWGSCSARAACRPTGDRDARAIVGHGHVGLDAADASVRFARAGVEVSFGAIGKGFALDRMAALLRERGARRALLSAGHSSVLAIGGKGRGWPVDLRPRLASRRVGRLWIKNGAVGTSGAGEQFIEVDGQRYGHVIDPRSGRPPRACSARASSPATPRRPTRSRPRSSSADRTCARATATRIPSHSRVLVLDEPANRRKCSAATTARHWRCCHESDAGTDGRRAAGISSRTIAGVPAVAALGAAAMARAGQGRPGPRRLHRRRRPGARAADARSITTTSEVKAIADIRPDSLAAADEVLKKADSRRRSTTSSSRTCCEHEDIEAIITAPPLWMHADIVTPASNAGKHVLCEKMMAKTRDGLPAR